MKIGRGNKLILTSYFANYKKYPVEYKLISVARITPHWFKGEKIVDNETYKSLAPSKKLLYGYKNKEISTSQYIKIYLQDISDIDIYKLYNIFDNYIFLCYEKIDEFCHRIILRKIFNKYNLPCKELR